MPKVSVIIPTYNHAHYLPKAIRSVLTQTYQDFEIIVVDDGSTDNPQEALLEFGPRVSYYCQNNQGLSAARNTGIALAHGEFLAFLDADDEWEPAFLETCVTTLGSNSKLAGVYTQMYHIDEVGNPWTQPRVEIVSPAQFRSRLVEGNLFPVHAALTRAGIIRDKGGFDTHLTSLEDWDLWLRVSLDYTMQGILAPLARYRVYPGAMSTNTTRMRANLMAVVAKHFGLPDGDVKTWSEDKRRAYGFAYRAGCILCLQEGKPDEGWDFLAKAVSIWPDLLKCLDTFYELACGDQPRWYRGRTDLLDIERNGAEMFKRLDSLFSKAGPSIELMRRTAYGNAYLALGMLSDLAGRWAAARRHLFRAFKTNPRLLTSFPVVRRLIKLCAGQRLVNTGRSMISRRQ